MLRKINQTTTTDVSIYGFFLLFFLSINFPGVLQPVKMLLLAFSFFCLILSRWYLDVKLSLSHVFLTLAVSCFGLVSIIYGVANDNPGSASYLKVIVLYPLLFIALLPISKYCNIKGIHRFLMAGMYSLVILQILYILSFFGLDGGWYFNFQKSLYKDELSIISGTGFLMFTHPGVASFLFFIPYCFSLILTSNKVETALSLLLLSMSTLMILTGRRVFYLVLICVLLFNLVYVLRSRTLTTRFTARLFWMSIIPTLALVFLIIHGAINIEVYAYRIESIFDFTSNESNLERVYQYEALMNGFYDNIFVGQGAGAVADYIRSHVQPWAYELSYIAMLFHFGIIGFFLYAFSVFVLFLFLYVFGLNSGHAVYCGMIAIFSGFFAILISNASNPYLLKFDYMWVIFLPILVLLQSTRCNKTMKMSTAE